MGAGTRWLESFLRSIKPGNTGALGPEGGAKQSGGEVGDERLGARIWVVNWFDHYRVWRRGNAWLGSRADPMSREMRN